MGNIYSCGPSSKYHFDCNAALTLPMRIKSCGLIKIPIEIIQFWATQVKLASQSVVLYAVRKGCSDTFQIWSIGGFKNSL